MLAGRMWCSGAARDENVGMLSARFKMPRAGGLGKREVSSVPPARGTNSVLLGFENRIKMMNCENDGFC